MPRRRPTAPEPPSEETIRLVFVEPRAVLGAGVREVLDGEPDIEIVGEARTAAEAMQVVDDTSPDVVLIDVPHVEALSSEATRRLRREAPESALVIMGGEDDDASIVGAFEVGAAGHVAELADGAALVSTIRRVADGKDPLKDELIGRPDLVERIVDSVRETILADRPPVNPLTRRELEVLGLAAEGLRNREIAERLGVSEQTIKNQLSSVLHKLGVPNRTNAVTYAVRHGWLVPGEGSPGRAYVTGEDAPGQAQETGSDAEPKVETGSSTG
jgi:DNA-binding NarL/FixJ family response regulator